MRPIVFIVIGLLAVGLFWFLKHEPVVTNYPSSGREIIAFGDSLIVGVGATTGNDLVSQLEGMVGVPIINLGNSGDTTGDGLARLETVTERDAKVVLILLGGNDAIQKVPIETTKKNLETIISNIHDTGAVVVLLGVRSGLLADGYRDMYQELAKEHNTAFVPDVLSGVFGRPNLMSDPIHPNDAGYKKIAERVAPILESTL